ncbi:MAG: hypothetical protein FVQ84_08435 [Planctomycetes bacterium]|nr:hypothetical protein [Planctomycetota bacterium]
MGLDEPSRMEGSPVHGIVLDEIDNMKEEVWAEHVRPALSDTNGWAMFIGVPEGRKQLYKYSRYSRTRPAWANFTWKSAEILPPEEIAQAKEDLDPLTFLQEYEASFVTFEGRAYYCYDENKHNVERLYYNHKLPLSFNFDFNVKPGTATVTQEQEYCGKNPDVSIVFTAVIGEVWIPQNSNTPAVCRKLAESWGYHKGEVYIYGDSTGGNAGTAKVTGSDWDIVERMMRRCFGDRVNMCVKDGCPRERARVNALNSRLMSTTGTISMLICAKNCPHTAEDLSAVVLLKGGSGEIDKKATPLHTHLSDGLGYQAEFEHPVSGDNRILVEEEVF